MSFFGTDLCEDIATMLSLVSFSVLRLAEFPEILLSVNKIRLFSVNDTQFLHSYMLLYGLRSFIINYTKNSENSCHLIKKPK